MKAVSVRELRNNPSVALREARKAPVVVLKRHRPEAVLVHLDDTLLDERGVREALALALYRDETLSLGRAAEFCGLAVTDFMLRASALGIPVVRGTAQSVRQDVETLAAWRAASDG